MSGIDLNRAGVPLLEIVSEPDMRSAEEAVAYAKTLHALVRWIDICDGNMQEGSFRCDANVSVRRKGEDKLGTRCEIKNLNSFRFLERAIEFEAKRQIEILEDGGKIVQETRLYDPDKEETRAMRTKEEAHDYRYFPDPDLMPLEVSEEWVERERAKLPELPQTKRARYQHEYGLSAYDAALLTESRETAVYFDAMVAELGKDVAKVAANWVIGEVLALLNRDRYGASMGDVPITAQELAKLINRERDGTLNKNSAKTVLRTIWLAGKVRDPRRPDIVDDTIEKHGLKQVSDSSAIEKIVDRVLAANAKQVEDYRAGKEKAFNSLVGQVMKATQGKANPAQVNEMLKRKLAG
jgi:aspartyl-tRNA(Asn)/glutamyl-tRNA(Gln) amidotransferase subunit B